MVTPVFLGVSTFELGWKIGTGISAKFLRIGIPAESPGNGAFDSLVERLDFTAAGTSLPQTSDTMPEDGWLWASGGRYLVERPDVDPCPRPLSPPSGYVRNPGTVALHYCPPLTYPLQYDSYYLPERGLGAPGPIEDYTGQPYTRSTDAPTPPAQSTVEQTIEAELDKPENELLRDWLNYKLGSPAQVDPVSGSFNMPDCSGMTFDTCSSLLENYGLPTPQEYVYDYVDTDFSRAPGSVRETIPAPGAPIDDIATQVEVRVEPEEADRPVETDDSDDACARGDGGTGIDPAPEVGNATNATQYEPVTTYAPFPRAIDPSDTSNPHGVFDTVQLLKGQAIDVRSTEPTQKWRGWGWRKIVAKHGWTRRMSPIPH